MIEKQPPTLRCLNWIARASARFALFATSLSVPAQSCVAPPPGLVSWWPGNGSPIDVAGTYNGALINGAGYGPGIVGEGFLFTEASQGVDVGPAPALQLQNFTIEAWIQRGSASFGTLDPNPGDASEAAFFSYGYQSYGFFLDNSSRLLLTQIGVGGSYSTTTITDTNFHHVAVTKTNTVVTFYVDGVFAGDDLNNTEVYGFGSDADIGAIGGSQACAFYGSIDELAIYNRALTAAEIQDIYAAGSAGKCLSPTILAQPTNEIGVLGTTNTFEVAASGELPLTYQWYFDTTPIAGATNSLLTIANIQLTNAGSYSLLISNVSGQILSSNAILSVVTPVSIGSGPSNFAAILGAPASFSVSAGGTPPLKYQWAFDGADIAGATNPDYVLNSVAFSNIGSYSVTVSNAWSVATASALLAFNPQITVNGQLGTNFAFTNAASPQVGISSFLSNAIIFYTLDGSTPGASSTPYQGPFAVTNSAIVRAVAYNQISNSATSLAVEIDIDEVCAIPPIGLISWWQAEGNALDFEGTNSGVLLNGAGYGPGEVGDAFSLTGATEAIDVGYATNLQLQNFSIEAWVRRYSATVGTLDTIEGDVGNAAFFSYGAGGYGFFLNNDDRLLLTELGVGGVYSTATLDDTNFHHIAVTKTNQVVAFYIDGVFAGGATDDNEVFTFGSHANIGAIGQAQGCSFYGAIDELAIYNRALSSNEVQRIYMAFGAGKCPSLAILSQPTNEVGLLGHSTAFAVTAFGQPPLAYQWFFNSAAITNATNTSLIITNTQPANAGNYSVVVYGNSAPVASSNALLTVVAPVAIASGPSNVAAVLGETADFSVLATGAPPLGYQWAFNGTNLPGATNSSYSVPNVDFSDIGSYSVVATNPWSVAAASALLAFNPQITINGQVGTNFAFTNVPPVQVQISSLFSNATIFYTLDGSTPTVDSTVYSGPFSLIQSAVVQAIAYDQDFASASSFAVDLTIIISNRLTIVNPGGGTVALNPPGGLYRNTQTVQVTATPTNGWTFLQWSGAVSSTSSTIEVPMLANQNLQAVFGAPITFSAPQNGSLQFNPNLSVFPYGSRVQISALPAAGYSFSLWGGNASGAVNPYVLTVTSPITTVAALFSALPAGKFSVVVIPNGNGLVGITPGGNSFASNLVVVIQASATGTNRFYYWTGATNTLLSPVQIAVRTNLVVTANFSGGEYAVQFSNPEITSTNIQFSLAGAPLQAYEIDVSSNLLDWTPLATATNKTGSILLSDTTSNSPQKFYRATLVP